MLTIIQVVPKKVPLERFFLSLPPPPNAVLSPILTKKQNFVVLFITSSLELILPLSTQDVIIFEFEMNALNENLISFESEINTKNEN